MVLSGGMLMFMSCLPSSLFCL